MADVAYLELLRDPRWQRKRLSILERDRWQCRGCGDREHNLQVHHKRYERGKMPWDIADRHLVTMCDRCHTRITKLRAAANDTLSELGPDQLEFAVGLIDRWTVSGSNPLQYTLACFESFKADFLSRPYGTAASRNLEAVDEILDVIWAALDADTPRSYGEA